MKTILSVVTALFLGAIFVGCSNENDPIIEDNPVPVEVVEDNNESSNKNDSIFIDENLLGSWQLLNYSGGIAGTTYTVEAGKIIVIFTKDGNIQVSNEENLHVPTFSTSMNTFSCVDVKQSMFTGQVAKGLLIGHHELYEYSILDGKLDLAESAYDGFCFILEKI